MTDYLVTDTELTQVADAIRTRRGSGGNLVFPSGFVSAIGNIPTSTTTIVDYDLTLHASGANRYAYYPGVSEFPHVISLASLWTSGSRLHIIVKRTSGLRAGYYYGSEITYYPIDTSSNSINPLAYVNYLCNSSGAVESYTAEPDMRNDSNNYGIYGGPLLSGGVLTLYSNADTSRTGTINGTFSVEIYKLTY